jgi:hypothetical protein
MANIDAQEFQTQVLQVVAELYQQRRSAIPGAVLKLALTRRAAEAGKYFDQRALGPGSFYDLVSRCNVTVQRRPGSDFVVLPKSIPVAETTQSDVRIQRDIWYAFVSFPVPSVRRTYDPVTHRVVYDDDSMALGGKVLIEPIPIEQQINWRREFATTIIGPEGEEPAKAVKAQNPFKDFSRLMRQRPSLGKQWNLFLFKRVVPIIEQWADHNKIPREQWLQSSKPKAVEDIDRRELYQFLDSVSIDDLMNLHVPLRWVIGRTKRTD